jgi:hypothetical protein
MFSFVPLVMQSNCLFEYAFFQSIHYLVLERIVLLDRPQILIIQQAVDLEQLLQDIQIEDRRLSSRSPQEQKVFRLRKSSRL